jgi:hypothetical protein
MNIEPYIIFMKPITNSQQKKIKSSNSLLGVPAPIVSAKYLSFL